MWSNFFDAIFLINLHERQDRLKQGMLQLALNKIPFELVRAVSHKRGAVGLYKTMVKIFTYALNKKYRRILVFEDDVLFLFDPATIMRSCLEEIPYDFHLLYLGANLCGPVRKYSPNLLSITNALSTHAVGYSDDAMRLILDVGEYIPFDELLRKKIQPYGKSYCTSVLLSTQRAGYSNIMNIPIDWHPLVEKHWKEWTRRMEIKTNT